MSNTAKIQFWSIAGMVVGAIIFILVAFGSEMLNTKASDTFAAYFKNGEVVDVIILTKSPYSEKKWNKVRVRIIDILATGNTGFAVPPAIVDMLKMNDIDIITISISPKVYKVYKVNSND